MWDLKAQREVLVEQELNACVEKQKMQSQSKQPVQLPEPFANLY